MKLAMHWMSIIVLLIWLMAGCSPRAPQPDRLPQLAGGVPKQLLDRQVIITLPLAAQAEWEQTSELLAQAYNLPRAGAFPLGSIWCPMRRLPSALRSVAARAYGSASSRSPS